jgi:hypothetical protein
VARIRALQQAATRLASRQDPATSWARAIWGITALRDHAFQPHLLCCSKQLHTVVETIKEAPPAVTGTHDKNHGNHHLNPGASLYHGPVILLEVR